MILDLRLIAVMPRELRMPIVVRGDAVSGSAFCQKFLLGLNRKMVDAKTIANDVGCDANRRVSDPN